jgi:hypothetical protein
LAALATGGAVDAAAIANGSADARNHASAATLAAAHFDAELISQNLMTEPLWASPNKPDWLEMSHIPNPNALDDDSAWAFWRRWYHGFLIGRPLEWELQRQVALIDNAIWEAGPEAVAAEIEKAEAKFRLEQEIKRLKMQLAETSIAPTIDRKHNNPPPLDDDGTARSEVITPIWTDLEALETEIAEEEPDPAKIKLIGQSL